MKTKNLVLSGMIAAIYVVMTVLPPFSPFSSGLVQFRVSEILMILCLFSPCGVWGVSIGCLVANIFVAGDLFNIIFGTFATLLSGLILYRWRDVFLKYKFLAPLPVVILNGLIVGTYLPFLLVNVTSIPFVFEAIAQGNVGQILAQSTPIGIAIVSVALGEAGVLYLLGIPFLWLLQKRKIF